MRKAIITIALVVAVVVLGIAGWLFWGSWISPPEKRAMNIALDRMDEVGSYEGGDQAVYEQKVRAAKAAILECQKKEITAYDRQLLPALDMQLDGAQTEHKARVNARTDPRYAQMLPKVAEGNRWSESVLREDIK